MMPLVEGEDEMQIGQRMIKLCESEHARSRRFVDFVRRGGICEKAVRNRKFQCNYCN
jgi:hypothetical protein